MNTLLDFIIIREDITPTNPPTVEKIDSFKFTSGETRTLAIQLINAYNKKPYILPTGWEISLEIKTLDPDVPLTKTGISNSLDRSIFTVILSNIETENVITSKLKITVFETATPTNKMIAVKDGIFVKNKIDCSC